MLAVGFGLCASMLWGVADFLGGLKARTLPLLPVLVVSQLAGLVVVAVIVAVRAEAPPDADFVVWAAVAGVASAVGLAALYKGLAVGKMGVVAPIVATVPLVPLTGGIVQGERPASLQWAGIGFALLGVLLAAREGGGEATGGGGRVAAGAGFAVVAALTFGGSLLALDAGSDSDPYWTTLTLRATSSVIVLGVVAAVRPGVAGGAAAYWPVALVGVLDMTATSLFAVASTRGLVSVVSVLSSLFPVVVVVLARVFLHERLGKTQKVGAAAALAGAALISAG